MRHLTLITTGGTIEKTYDEQSGTLDNRRSIVRRMLRRLRLEGARVSTIELMSKDSLAMTDDDRLRILEVVRATASTRLRPESPDQRGGVVILHGTDTLCTTGELLHQHLAAVPGELQEAVVLTGAMRPFEMTRSDALQNLTEAVFAAGTLAPGVYCVAHGRALAFPGVRKDRERGTFIKG
jgi:L-asparaginase